MVDDVSSARMSIRIVEPSTVSAADAGVLTFVTGSQYSARMLPPPTTVNDAIPVEVFTGIQYPNGMRTALMPFRRSQAKSDSVMNVSR